MKYNINKCHKKPRIKFTTTLDLELVKELKVISYETKTPISELIEAPLMEFLRNQDTFDQFMDIVRNYKFSIQLGQATIKK